MRAAVSYRSRSRSLVLAGIVLAKITRVMKNTIQEILFAALVISVCLVSINGVAQTIQTPQLSDQEKQLVKVFDEKVKSYVKQREAVRKKLPPLSKDATPEQIQAFQTSFIEQTRAARPNSKQGDLFIPPVSTYMRSLIKTEFKGTDRAQLRKTVLEADTKGVPLRVNYPYPETKELSEMPPTLLLRLPPLPKEVKYRFVNRHLLLVDTDNGLIVDYMLNALP